jgi:hypothetical protein
VARYFGEVLIDENLVFSLAPMPFTTAMMASEMPAAINPYSIAVAPVSSAQNLRTDAIMPGRCAPTYEAIVNIDQNKRRSGDLVKEFCDLGHHRPIGGIE